jgi:hypothetical protein
VLPKQREIEVRVRVREVMLLEEGVGPRGWCISWNSYRTERNMCPGQMLPMNVNICKYRQVRMQIVLSTISHPKWLLEYDNTFICFLPCYYCLQMSDCSSSIKFTLQTCPGTVSERFDANIATRCRVGRLQ